MTEPRSDTYALRLSEAELARYAMMAELARTSEADLWQAAGIAPGAAVPDAVAQAQAFAAANGWPQVRVQVGRADATGLEPGGFDTVMMRHVLAHNGPTEQPIVDHLST